MADMIINEFAQARSLATVEDTAVHIENGYTFSYANYPALQNWGVTVLVDDLAWSKEKLKQLKKLAKSQKMGRVVYTKGTLQVISGSITKKGKIESMDKATAMLLYELPKMGVPPQSVCHYCGQPGCDDKVVDEHICYPAHAVCKEQKVESIIAEVEQNRESGNMLLGVIGALIGGVVGSLPSLITIHFFDTIYGLLFALIPLAAYFGYKLFKGVMNAAVPIVVSLVSLISTLIMVLGYIYALFAMSDEGLFLKSIGESTFKLFMEFIVGEDAREILLETLAMPMLFCVLGIVIAWGQISRTNKHKIKQAQALRQSLYR